MPLVIRSYQASFDLLCRDLDQVLEFIEPVDANATTFSHRIYGLILRVCTDFESLAKDLLVVANHPTPPDKMTVNDYRKLNSPFRLESVEVEFLPWRPQPRRVWPFRNWSIAQPPLQWYQDYNVVKHNRDGEFSRASLSVLIEATSGLFALLATGCKFHWDECSWSRDNGGYEFWREPFRMRGPEQG